MPEIHIERLEPCPLNEEAGIENLIKCTIQTTLKKAGLDQVSVEQYSGNEERITCIKWSPELTEKIIQAITEIQKTLNETMRESLGELKWAVASSK